MVDLKKTPFDAGAFLASAGPFFLAQGPHITLQYGELGGIWVPVTFDAIANVRILGEFTLAGLNIERSESLSADPR